MNDYISRGDVLNALCGECENYKLCFFGEGEIPVCHVFWKMQNIPAADVVERKSGEWIEHGEPNEYGVYQSWYWTCSNCGAVGYHEFNFCPNCGADMRKGGEA